MFLLHLESSYMELHNDYLIMLLVSCQLLHWQPIITVSTTFRKSLHGAAQWLFEQGDRAVSLIMLLNSCQLRQLLHWQPIITVSTTFRKSLHGAAQWLSEQGADEHCGGKAGILPHPLHWL